MSERNLSPERAAARLVALIDGFRQQSSEKAWVEFKENNADPDMIGELISAVANSATYHDEAFGYVVWGIINDIHQVVGTALIPIPAEFRSNL